MNFRFKVSRSKVLLFSGKKLVSSEEDYVAYMKKTAADYTPKQIVINDESVKNDVAVDALFCVIPEHRDLNKKYDFPYSPDLSDKENVLAIMNHLTEHTYYCGATRNILPDDGAEILENAFDLPFDKALNCRSKAIVLTDILNSCGIKSLPVCCMLNEGGCHFLVNVWLKEENRFIVVDPSFNCFFTDETGRELSVCELRDSIIKNKAVTVNGYSFLSTDEFKNYYFSAFICDLMANLSTWKTNIRGKKELSKVCGVNFDAKVPETLDY
ncbi:MAG: hypothetical protein IK080_09275 [Clostridia bacterium]|nr:hypothetical protein [Clostridia bacterium]